MFVKMCVTIFTVTPSVVSLNVVMVNVAVPDLLNTPMMSLTKCRCYKPFSPILMLLQNKLERLFLTDLEYCLLFESKAGTHST
jgi:hypothetical protein